jgi:hypothetical protein
MGTKSIRVEPTQSSGKSAWRRAGDPPLPGIKQPKVAARKSKQRDRTYGGQPDMLDLPGTIVEPDVRAKIADYFEKMKLREMLRDLIREIID